MHWSPPRQPNAKPRQPTARSSRTSLTMSRSSSSVYTKSPLRMRTKATTSAASASAARTSAGEGVRPPQCSDARAQISTRSAPPLTAFRTLSRLSQQASRTTHGACGVSSASACGVSSASTSHAGCSSSAMFFEACCCRRLFAVLRSAVFRCCQIDACSIDAFRSTWQGGASVRQRV